MGNSDLRAFKSNIISDFFKDLFSSGIFAAVSTVIFAF